MSIAGPTTIINQIHENMPPSSESIVATDMIREDFVPYLQVSNLDCIRSGRLLFSDLSFTLKAGGIIQVDGTNGSGKTSLLRILCGLSLPEQGEVIWCGSPIQDAREEYLSEVSYVGHNHGVKADLTPLENLRIVQALGQSADAMSPELALETIGLEDEMDLPVRSLSAGQRRRVALARLLVTKTKLWILDEPFTALDKAGRKTIEALIADHSEQDGMTVLTTHQSIDLPVHNVTRIHTGI